MRAMAFVLFLVINSLGAFAQADSKKEVKPGQSAVLHAGESAIAEGLVRYDAYLVDDPGKPVSSKEQGEGRQVLGVHDGEITVFQSPDAFDVSEDWKLTPLDVVISSTSKESHKLRLSVECITEQKNMTLDIPAGKALSFGSWLRKKLACSGDVAH
jgi:hypothetical protein